MNMIRKLSLAAALALAPAGAMAAGAAGHIEDFAFSFEGPFGKYDELQLQRGLKVFTEVCAACHGLEHVAIRSLADKGGPALPEDQVRAYAKNLSPVALPDGEERARETSDHFPASGLPNAPDLSLMAKARSGFHGPYGLGINQFVNGIGGPEYIASLLTGYTGNEKEEAGSTFYENTAFPGGWIAMAPPLASDGLVEFDDGHANTARAMAEDVTAFLMWTAEPKMMARKQAGFTAVIFLGILAVLLYLTNKKLWSGIKGRKKKHA